MEVTNRWITQVNEAAKQASPFFLFTDFELGKPRFFYPAELVENNILVDFPGFRNVETNHIPGPVAIQPSIENGIADYTPRFDTVQRGLHYGNSYLCNLTMATPVRIEGDWLDLFYAAKARYKIAFRDEWICFSPEMFIRIQGDTIATFPMKGTLNANLPHAEQVLLNDPKEKAEHYTIVDLLRNDLSKVATEVHVKRFRYLETLSTSGKNLLQCSSEICGKLAPGWQARLGNIIAELLPAGSISGAPKKATCNLIQEAEAGPRGYYTGVAFYFDGKQLDSTVMIRFVEKQEDGYVYRSGGGITIHSVPEDEYQELLDKIYVPRV